MHRRWQLSWLAGAAEGYPAGHSFAMLACLEELWPTAELVITAQKPPEELRGFLREAPRLGLTVLVKTQENAGTLAALAPFTKDYPIPAQRKSTSAAIELPDGMAPSYASFVRVSSCSPLEA